MLTLVIVSLAFAWCKKKKESQARTHTVKLATRERPTANRNLSKNFASHLSNFMYTFWLYLYIQNCLYDQQILQKADANRRGSELLYDLSTS
jgi:hypothetical protein